MSSRTYLSIGDVLSLLREEFPDVTISKIRFLESQGLVNPERSPSGYRKFYEKDVERLRWVLRQQREHFLPLKIIRDRLASETGVELEAVPEANGSVPEPAVVGAGVGSRERISTAEHAPAERAVAQSTPPSGVRITPPVPPSQPSGGAAPPATPARPAASAGSPPAPPAGREGLPGIGDPARAAGPTTAPTSSPASAPAPAVRPGQGANAPRQAAPASAPTAPGPTRQFDTARGTDGGSRPAATVAPAPTPTSPSPPAPAAAPAPAAPPAPATAGQAPDAFDGAAGLTGASMTMEELSAATGLPATTIASLEGFGLISPMAVAGVLYYDEDALTVAKTVSEFARFGIEPRHLRPYRNAVDREMGLIEQVVTPLLRQRNPESRQRAVDAAGELAKLGQSLRASLLRREMRRQLGG